MIQQWQVSPWRWQIDRNDPNLLVSTIRDPQNGFVKHNDIFDLIVGEADLIVEESFGAHLDGHDSTREHLLGVDRLSIVHQRGKVLGFASARIYPEHRLLYLHGVVVHTSLKGKGVGRALIQTLTGSDDIDWIAFTTQNPIMFRMLQSLCKTAIFPSPKSPIVPRFLHAIGKELVNGRDGVFHVDRFVIDNLYHKCLYGQIPTISEIPVQNWFDEALHIKSNRKSNDGFLLLGHLS